MIRTCILLLSICVAFPEASRILLAPMSWKSHVSVMCLIGKALQDKGHEVSMLLSESYPGLQSLKEESTIEIFAHKIAVEDFYTSQTEESTVDLIDEFKLKTPIQELRENELFEAPFAINVLSDEEVLGLLKKKRFDLAIADGTTHARYLLVVPYILDIPYVAFSTSYEPWLIGAPALSSFVPFPFAETTERMSFWERLHNMYTLLDWTACTRVRYLSDQFISKFIKNKPFKSMNEIARGAKFWLMYNDAVLDYPRPKMANEADIGGISVKPIRPLEGDFKEFVEGSTEDVVVMSFGSYDVLSKPRLEMFLEAFRSVNARVVVKGSIDSSDMNIPDNVLVKSWIPQNDLLGHSKTKLLVTHGGVNSQFESVFNRVPSLSFPIFYDQLYNAKRAEYHGYGQYMDILQVTPESVAKSINTMLMNQSYIENVQKASKIVQSRNQTPLEVAVYWVEHILQFGGDHLRSSALDLPWYQYLMLDMLAIFLVAVHVCIKLISCMCRYMFKLVKTRSQSKVKQS